MFNADLTNCDVEPIRIPGKIQSYGFLVAVDQNHKIIYCSDNISSFVVISADELLSKSITSLEQSLSTKTNQVHLATIIKLVASQPVGPSESPYPIQVNSLNFNLLISRTETLYILEFEPETLNNSVDETADLGVALSGILTANRLPDLLTTATVQIKKIIGYDRVMIYRFHEDGHGEVAAEAKNDDLNTWIGLHFPASDIPKQARDLYKTNLTRQIADVHSESIALAGLKENEHYSFDMANVSMRAVSPIHIQYLKNMGVASSFSISLLYHGELWGLVACHSYTTRFVNFKARNAAKLVGQVFSAALSYRQLQEDQEKANKFSSSIDALGMNLLNAPNIPDAIFTDHKLLLDVVDASGAILYYDNQLFVAGKVPDKDFCLKLVEWVTNYTQDNYFENNCLSNFFPEASPYKELVSGIMACVLSAELNEVIIWLRGEVVSSLTWAGDPTKNATVDENGMSTIHPRTSFANWTEAIRDCSITWKNEEIQAAKQVREKIVSAINRKANEMRLLNSRLKEAYEELDAFSYTLSHDLKNPLTSIKSFSQLLERNKNIDESGKKMISRILSSANKMHFMIGDILDYSRVGQERNAHSKINMTNLVQEIIQESENPIDHTIIDVDTCLDIHGDKTMIMQVFANLIGNAIKYSQKSTQPKISISSLDDRTYIQYNISDNGIGIDPTEHEKVFELFKRSEHVKDFEGTGVGLSIVKKIVERHKGKIWVESDGQNGSTFYVSFLKPTIN